MCEIWLPLIMFTARVMASKSERTSRFNFQPRPPPKFQSLSFPSHQWGHTFPFEGAEERRKKTHPVISNLLGGRGDGFTGTIITCYMKRSIMEYEYKNKKINDERGFNVRNSIQKQPSYNRRKSRQLVTLKCKSEDQLHHTWWGRGSSDNLSHM